MGKIIIKILLLSFLILGWVGVIEGIETIEKQRIALLNSETIGVSGIYGQAIVDDFCNSLEKYGVFNVIERASIEDVIKRQGLTVTEAVRMDKAIKNTYMLRKAVIDCAPSYSLYTSI